MQHHQSYQQGGIAFIVWIPILLIIGIALVYLIGVILERKKWNKWSIWRTLSFVCGICLLAIAMWPPIVQWAHHDLRGHMVQHLLIGMFAPIFLVLGAPITLALISLPVKVSRSLTSILKSNIFKFLSYPLTALILNIGGMYVLYLTPLYNESFTRPYLHHAIHIHFLAAGVLFTWSMIGPDPVPKRPGLRLRMVVLFVGIAAHAFLSKLMYAWLFPFNSPHSNDQIREAAKLMYYGGDLSELLLVIGLYSIWYRKRSHQRHALVQSV